VTGHHRGPKRKLQAGYRALSLKRTSCGDYFSLSSVVSCTFSVLCVNLKIWHHPHPPGYLCATFHFFHGLHCGASRWRKITYSVTQSHTHTAYYLKHREPKLALRNNQRLVNQRINHTWCNWHLDKHSCMILLSLLSNHVCLTLETKCEKMALTASMLVASIIMRTVSPLRIFTTPLNTLGLL